jgi:hypothetical protein
MNTKNRKTVRAFSIVITALFILAQVIFIGTSSAGAWCSPYLGAPVELGHPLYQYVYYGFPSPFVTVVRESCFEAQSTTYEWSPIGLGVDGLLLVLLAYPIWSRLLRKRATE